jgi:alpha-tubulin suppressor-like RCC1 family protein
VLAAVACGSDPTGPSGGSYISISAGADYACAALKDGSLNCWGLNFAGTLGIGTLTGPELTPVRVTTTTRFRQVSAGTAITCGIALDQRLHCWGSDTESVRLVPELVDDSPVTAWRQVSVDRSHFCGLDTSGAAHCEGFNAQGWLGDGTRITRTTPVPVAGQLTFRSISAGVRHTCGVTPAGAAWCWGDNSFGILGLGVVLGGDRLEPVSVVGDLVFDTVDAGVRNTCGLTSAQSPDGAHAYCWGDNAVGSVGDGTNTLRSRPTLVTAPDGVEWTQISVGNSHVCALARTGAAYCWGANGDGRLGDGTTTNRNVPTLVTGGLTFRMIAAGDAHNSGNPGLGHTCGLTTGGAVYCWGSNGNGALGDGTTETRLVPTRVSSPEG